jgi:hypothetical protein
LHILLSIRAGLAMACRHEVPYWFVAKVLKPSCRYLAGGAEG